MSNVVVFDKIYPVVTRSKIKTSRRGNKKNSTSMRVEEDNFKILQIGDHESVMTNNYNVKQLKDMCRAHKLKVGGTKGELTRRLYTYLRESLYIRCIQRAWRNSLTMICIKLRGPGYKKRELCVNETDFFSMDSIKNILPQQFISYTCPYDNKVYGFDINSMYQLLAKGGQTNPYTRKQLPSSVTRNINRLIRLSALTGQKINFDVEDSENINPTKRLELATISLFQNIDALGNITNHLWFWSLERHQLLRFIRELADIWGYRAQLQDSMKREICPPDGNPFRGIDLPTTTNGLQLNYVRQVILEVMENIVKRGTNPGARSLGANYVLCALTLVSTEAASALPWLYDAVALIQ